MRHGISLPLGDGFDTRYAEDLALCAQHGLLDVRLPFDWATLQPRPGQWDGKRAEWYRQVLDAADEVGVRVWATLFDRTARLPGWFADDHGFADDKTTGRYWPRWVEAMTNAFGDRVGGWFPFDDPVRFAVEHSDGDLQRHSDVQINLIMAWRDAWRVLRGGPPVATSLAIFGPALTDDLWATLWIRALSDGTMAVPGRMERDIADLGGSVDVLGLRLAIDAGTERWEHGVGDALQRAAEGLADHDVAIAQLAVRAPDADEQGIVFEAASHVLAEAKSDGVALAVAFTPFSHVFTIDRDPRPTLDAWT